MKKLHWRLLEVETKMDDLDAKEDWTNDDVRMYNSLEREWDELRNRLGLGYCVA